MDCGEFLAEMALLIVKLLAICVVLALAITGLVLYMGWL